MNMYKIAVFLKVSVSDVKMQSDGTVEFYSSGGQYPASKWLIPQYDVIHLNPLESLKMEYIVNVEKEMPGGGYSGAVAFQIYDKQNDQVSGKKFGSMVSLNVLADGITTGGSIASFTMPRLQYKEPIKFGFLLQNNGNANLAASGKIVFTDIFGREVDTFQTGNLTVLSNTSRQFDFTWTDAPLFGIYRARVQLSNAMRQDNQMTSNAFLIYLPWQKVLPVLIIGMAALAAFLLRKYGKYFTLPEKVKVAVNAVQTKTLAMVNGPKPRKKRKT